MSFNLDNMADVLRSRGLKVVEVEGWKYRGYAQQDLKDARGVLWHHTATHRSAFFNSNAPTLNVLINGHSGLPGPLGNIGLGRDGTCYIVATGVANHAGTGRAHNVPVNEGNHYLIGIEMESSGVAPWDWTPEMLAAAPKLGAALEIAYLQDQPEDERLQLGHMEYSDAGKIDPAGWPGGMDGLRASINAQVAAWQGAAVPAAPTSKPLPAPAGKPASTRKTYGADDIHWTVEKGDTLTKIARYYGIPEKVQAIADHNGINPNALAVGDKVWIPGPLAWTIEAPDTIRSVAAYYGLDAGYLARLNDLPGPDATIYIGNTLWIKK